MLAVTSARTVEHLAVMLAGTLLITLFTTFAAMRLHARLRRLDRGHDADLRAGLTAAALVIALLMLTLALFNVVSGAGDAHPRKAGPASYTPPPLRSSSEVAN